MEQLFRHDAGRLTSVLTRILGPQNLQLAEDVVQEAFVLAMRTWPDDGIPDNPSAWLLTTARNRAIDAIRRERTRRTFADDLAVYLDSDWTLALTVDEQFGENWIRDDQLRMIFMCCLPTLTVENRVTLILKTLCGFSVPAIARALLTTESTINKRLYRTRRALGVCVSNCHLTPSFQTRSTRSIRRSTCSSTKGISRRLRSRSSASCAGMRCC